MVDRSGKRLPYPYGFKGPVSALEGPSCVRNGGSLIFATQGIKPIATEIHA